MKSRTMFKLFSSLRRGLPAISVALVALLMLLGAGLPPHAAPVWAVAAPKSPLASALWPQTAKLDPADGGSYDRFGAHLAMSGDTLVVGAYDDADANGHNAGAAYVFEQGTGWADGHANQVAKIYPDDGDSGDQFGYKVAICGDTVVAGVNYDEDPNGTNSGSVYVFEKGVGWADGYNNQVAKLHPDDGDADDRFGFSVAVSGDTIVVGAPYDEHPNGDYSGSIYVFQKGAGWADGYANLIAKLDPDDGELSDYFGYSVGVDGDTVVAGAHLEDDNGSNAGAVYVFEKGASWSDGHANQVAKLFPNDADIGDTFGLALDIDAGVLVVSAYYDEDPNGSSSGSAYVFEKDGGWADGSANQVAKIYPDDGDSDDRFGGSLAIDGDTVVVAAAFDEDPHGSEAGSVYLFEKGGGWQDGHANQADKLVAADGDGGDRFGRSVAASGTTAVVGTVLDEDPNGYNAGSAYVFRRAEAEDVYTFLPLIQRNP